MKTLTLKEIGHIIRALILFLSAILFFIACRDRKSADPNPLEQMQQQLEGTWTVTQATLSGTDMTVYYQDLQLTFNADYTYTCVNEVDPVWPITGTYEILLENSQLVILRSDQVKMMVTTLDDHELIIQFSWSGKAPSGGRMESLNGEYIFTFTK